MIAAATREVDEYGPPGAYSSCPCPGRALVVAGPVVPNDQEFRVSSSSFPAGTDLTTDRLVLRPWSADELAAVLGDVRSADWAEDFPAEGDQVIAGVVAEQSDVPRRYGHRQIVERTTGLVVGSISLLWPPNDGALEIGYGVVASRRGRGYAAEATRALVAYALTSPQVDIVYADVELSNPASIRVLEKAGLRRWSGDATTARFRATAPEPNRRRP
ncbi:GNAT family N-acetyltransferase [Embleya sp. NBC_00888]|uniref:GNAT family N-acetyltransferase n=1 Tax=Embleya sp. NBC_00888 TaxID=2975960 RepID=UPI00386808EA